MHKCVGGLLRSMFGRRLTGNLSVAAAEEETMETERPGSQDPEVVPDETGTPPEVSPTEPTGKGDEGDDTTPH